VEEVVAAARVVVVAEEGRATGGRRYGEESGRDDI
jgi:hypothetical protein